MGQYYITGIRKQNNKRFKAYESDQGLKLMEHSYIGNFFMQFICKQIEDCPSYVIWCGDYFDPDEDIIKADCSSDTSGFDARLLWKHKSYEWEWHDDDTFDYKGKYLVNLDAKTYLSFDEYIETCMLGKLRDPGWVVHPLSLLTANSNGKGGGDYYEEELNADVVGSWCDCLLVITSNKPDSSFTDVTQDVLFEERN